MGYSHLAPQQGKLCGVETLCAPRTRELGREVGARDGRHVRGDVGEGGAQGRDGRVPEVIARLDALDVVERRVARADDGHGPAGHGRAVEGRQVACVAQRPEGADDGGEGGGAVGLDVHEEVEGLAGGGVVHAVPGPARDEPGGWVLGLEDGQDGLDVEAVEGAPVGQGGLLVADVEGPVVEPDVGLDGDGTDGQG